MNQPIHLDKQTPDGTQLNLDALYKIAPSCFTEAGDDNGVVRRVVDFKKLRQLLGDNAVEDTPEAYDFTWVGKRAALREAAAPIAKTLRPCVEESVDWDTTQNLYIEGDNLEVLKLLQNSYMNKVKMIYIDPPYNTGNDFVYKDSRTLSANEYNDAILNDEGHRLVKNTYSNGSFHSDWCSMIYSRLMIARSLLSEDGVIFISIDDNEERNLKNICDEVFGTSNFIAMLPTIMNLKGNQDEYAFAGTHEYTCVYTKNKESKVFGYFDIDESDDEFLSWESDEIGYYKKGANLKSTGVNAPREKRPNLFFPIYVRGNSYSLNYFEGATEELPITDGKEMSWRWSKNKFLKEHHNVIISNENGKISLYKKQRPALGDLPTKKPKSLFYKPEYSSGNGTAQVKDLFGNKIFSNPKPFDLIKDFIKIGIDKNAIILDFFSGSATTAHAVMQLNAEDGGNRKFIMVQLPEETDEKSEAYKAGFKNICEIGKERIRRAGKKIKEENISTTRQLDVGFRVFKCESSNYKDVAFAPKDYSQDMLEGLLDNIKDDRTDLDLLFGCMLRWGVELSLPLSKTTVDGCTIHNVNDGDLVACFDGEMTEAAIDAIAGMSPTRVVFRDSNFSEAAQKMNLFELFKQKCGWTDDEVKNNVRVI